MIFKATRSPRRAPCRGFDQVRGGHEKGCASQAGGEDRRLRGGRCWWGEGRGGDGMRRPGLDSNSEEDLTDDQIIDGLERLTAESLAEDSNY